MQPGPSRLVEMAHLAREHFINGVSMVELAESTGMSRFRVSRLLSEARELGVLKITVGASESLVMSEVGPLKDSYGVQSIHCVDTPDTTEALRDSLGMLAARYLEHEVQPGEVLGFASGRTLSAISPHLTRLPPCDVVQLTGLAGEPGTTAADLVRTVCAASGGAASALYAPLVASDPSAAQTFREQVVVAETLARMSEVTRAVLAVGSWSPPSSELVSVIGVDQTAEMVRQGARADVATFVFDASGRRVTALDDRVISIPFDVLSRIPEVVVVAGGAEKHEALRAVLRAGFVTTLITDRDTVSFLARSVANGDDISD